MKNILTFIAVQDGKIKRSSLETLTHCRELSATNGMQLDAALITDDAAGYVDTLAQYGPNRIYTISSELFDQHLNAPLIAALAAIINKAQPDVVAFASSESVKDILGALSIRVNGVPLPDVASFHLVEDGVEAVRPVMAAKILARTKATGNPVLVSVRSGSYSTSKAPASPEVEEVPFSFEKDTLRQTLREVIKPSGGAVDLSEAQIVVSAGRGVKDEEGKALIVELAAVLGAAIGSSRAVVENGLFPATAQIGQTGKVVAPDLYFAVGISGAIQHVAGMSNSRVIVAINKDADAPIFNYATYGLAGDLYKILPLLIEAVKEIKHG